MWAECATVPSIPISSDFPQLVNTIPGLPEHVARLMEPAHITQICSGFAFSEDDQAAGIPSSHPALEAAENVTITDLGAGISRDIFCDIGVHSRDVICQLMRTGMFMRTVGTASKYLWRDATEREFNLPGPMKGICPYRTFQFLSCYRSYIGKYLMNRNAGKKKRDCPPILNLSLLEIELTTAGLLVCVWKRTSNDQRLVKQDPFLAATTSGEDNISDVFKLRPPTEDNSSLPPINTYKTYSSDQWIAKRCSIEDWLRSAAWQDQFFCGVVRLLRSKHLFRLQTDHVGNIHPDYLMPDGSLPLSLPKPGLYEDILSGLQVFVCFNQHEMKISKVVHQHHEDFGRSPRVKLVSAMVMTEEDQTERDDLRYLSFHKGLSGNPRELSNGQHMVILPQCYGHDFPFYAKAWYTAFPFENECYYGFKKIIVQNHTCFHLLRWGIVWSFKRRDDIS